MLIVKSDTNVLSLDWGRADHIGVARLGEKYITCHRIIWCCLYYY